MRAILCLFFLGAAALGPREDWEKIVALDAGPATPPRTEEEAKAVALAHTGKQEAALRGFLSAHAEDLHAFEARLRLARVVAWRADLRGEALPAETDELIRDAAALAATPAERAEVDFARIAQRMRQSRARRPTPEERQGLLSAARTFQRSHPRDRRIGALLAEVATLFDGDAKTKERLLTDAKALTKDPGVLAQIADDTKRLTWLGRALPLRFTGLDGSRVDVKDWRGRPVVVVFFATWSVPSRSVLPEMRRVAEAAGAALVAVSLDTDAAALKKFLAAEKLTPPVAWDGKSWESPLPQALGLNALPSVWLLDKKGIVRTLDALDAPEELLRKLGRE